MNQTGYTVLKIPKTGAAFAYAKQARDFATGATGAGGYLHTTATDQEWRDVRFVSAILEGSSSLPVSIGASYSDLYTGAATVIGGTTPIGDLRSEDGPYFTVGSSSLYYTKKGQEYGGAFYAAYIGGTNSLPTKIGVGTTAGDITASGYFEGSFTTNDIHEFQTSFTADSTDLSKITTGSGVYTEGADVTLQFNILNRNGEQLASAAQIAADPFVSGQKISILNTDGTVAFSDYRIGGDSTFTFSSSQNIDVFGTFTRNFGIRNEVVNQDGGVHTSEFYLYANTATFDKVFVRSSGQTVLNESYTNNSPPNTGSITSSSSRADAIKYFNNQPINNSGVTGFIEFDLGFNESPNFTSLGDLVVFYGTGEDFETNRGSLAGNFSLSSVQEGQKIRLTANDGIPEGTGLFFKLAADTEVGFNEELFTVGPFTLEPEVEGPDLNLYNQGDQTLVGDFTIEGGLEGDDADGGNLNVSGNALGTGEAGRLTGPTGIPYLLSGDAAGGGGSDTLQDVTDRGNLTTQRVGIGTTISFTSAQLKVVRNNLPFFSEVELATDDGYSIKSSQKAAIATVGIGTTSINSTGSMIAGGSGHHISGDFDTIAGGTLNNISGGNFNFIGGGSQVDITGSEYSSSIGGRNNDILDSNYSIIGGGLNNKIKDAGSSFIGGGEVNQIHDPVSAIVGGNAHLISGGNGYSFIGGGEENEIHGTFSSVLGGEGNKNYGSDSVTLGGWFTQSSGRFALVGPGEASKVSGDYAVALGNKVEIPVAHTGATVLADGQERVHASSGMHTATLDFASGVYVPTIGYFGEGLHVSGVPVLTGENNPAEADTLQTVTDRGATTTNAVQLNGGVVINEGGSDLDFRVEGDTATHALFVNGADNHVGIGTATPISDLTVYSSDSNSATASIHCINNNETGSLLRLVEGNNHMGGFLQYDGSANKFNIGVHSTSDITFANDTKAITIDRDTAKVGIGTTNPASILDVNGGSANGVKIQAANAATEYVLNAATSNGTSRLWVGGAGDVGIGSVSPTTKLDVQGIATANALRSRVGNINFNLITRNDSAYSLYVQASQSNSQQQIASFRYGNGAAGQGTEVLAVRRGISYFNDTFLGIGKAGADTQLDVDGITTSLGFQTNQGNTNFNLLSRNSAGNSALYVQHASNNTNQPIAIFAYGATAANGGQQVLKVGKDISYFINTKVGIGTSNPAYTLEVDVSNDDWVRFKSDDNKMGLILADNDTVQYLMAENSALSLGHQPALHNENLNIIDGGAVGIGTTNPAVNLHVESSNSAQFKVGNGTQFVRLYADADEATILADGSVDMRFYTGGGEKMRLDTAGRLGIGSTSPQGRLDAGADTDQNIFLGRARFGSHVTDYLYLSHYDNASSTSYALKQSPAGSTAINAKAGMNVSMNVNNSAVVFVQGSTSNVGIGTNNPSDNLTVEGGGITLRGVGRIQGIDTVSASTDAANKAYVDAQVATSDTLQEVTDNGNTTTNSIGIGTTSPQTKLHVTQGTDDNTDGIRLSRSNSNASYSQYIDTGARFNIGYSNPSTADPDPQITLEQGGDVGIGTTSPSYKLEVAGQVQTHERLRIGSGGNNQDGELRARVIRLSNDTGNSTAKISSTGAYGRDLIYHAISHNLRYYNSTRLKLNQTEAVFNDDGADVDFRVEGSGEANALFVQGSNGYVGIGTNSPAGKLQVYTSANRHTKILGSTADLEVVSDNNTNPVALIKGVGTADLLNVFDNTTEVFTILDGGNVGIGITAPIKKLQVDGSILGKNNGGYLQYDAQGNVATILNLTTANELSIGQASHVDSMSFNVGGTDDAMFIDSSANVCIGNSSAGAKLDIRQDAGVAIRCEDAAGGYFVVNHGGDVGIGTNSPDSKLHVELANAALGFDQGITIQSNRSNFTAGRGGGIIMKNADVTTAGIFGIRQTSSFRGALAFYTHTSDTGNTFDTTFTEKMRIDSDGNVGIGTDAPSFFLDVETSDNTVASFVSTTNKASIIIQDDTTLGYFSAENDIISIGAAAGATATNLCINQNNNRVGIGTNVPGALLDIRGDMRLDSGGNTDRSIYFRNQATVAKVRSDAALQFDVGVGASPSAAMYIEEDTRNIGIGTITPGTNAHLEIYKDNPQIVLTDSNEGTNDKTFRFININESLRITARTDGNTANTAGGDIMTLERDGNVGIGTDSPSEKLTVDGNIRINGNSREFYFAGNQAQIRASSASTDITFVNSSTELVRFASDGNVGIGTDSPARNLSVASSSANVVMQLANSTTAYAADNGLEVFVSDNDAGIVNRENGYLRFDTNNDERIRIQANGSVGIGTNIAPHKLTVKGTISRTNSANIQIINLGSNGEHGQLTINNSGGTPKAVIESNADSYFNGGNVGIGTNSPSSKLELNGTLEISPAEPTINLNRNNGSYSWKIVNGAGSGNFPLSTFNIANNAGTPVITIVDGGNVGIGTTSPSNALDVVGHFSATSKSFLIDHPTKENKKLQYASLEGPENGVYVRGTTDEETIELPEYWSELVHNESITVVLTPIGKKQDLFIIKKSNKLIKIGGIEGSYDYVVYGERKDIDRLEVEPDGN